MKQKTLREAVHFEGRGLHTGQSVKLSVHPAEANTGIHFCRVDLNPDLKVHAKIENVRSDELRQTTLVVGGGCGKLKGGQHLKYPEQTQLANLLLTLMDRAGVPAEKVGLSTGMLSEL